MKKNQNFKLQITIFFLLLASATYSLEDAPKEKIRVMQSDVFFWYLPSVIGNSTIPWHDNFELAGSWVNLFARGHNLNFYYGFTHRVADSLAMPLSASNTGGWEYTPQSRDRLYAQARYSFATFFQVNLRTTWLQNRLVSQSPQYQDYNYNQLAASLDLTYDARYSPLQEWNQGMVFLYPQQGTLLRAGAENMLVHNLQSGRLENLTIVSAYCQQLFALSPLFTLDFELGARSHLSAAPHRAYLLNTSVISTYETPGEYTADAVAELRFLWPGGAFLETPPFWYFSSFLLKFSPGVIAGVNGGLAGSLSGGTPDLLGSVYIAPIVTIRLDGKLVSVLRMDIGLGSGMKTQAVFSLNFGFNMNEKSVPLYRAGL